MLKELLFPVYLAQPQEIHVIGLHVLVSVSTHSNIYQRKAVL